MSTNAATVYWDINGTTTGASGSGAATGTWDGVNTFFNTDSTGGNGGSIAAWTAGDVLAFAAGTNATNAYTVTVSGTQQIGGLIFEEGLVTLSGGTLQMTAASNFDVASGLTATVSSIVDGAFDLTKLGGGTLVLGGNNTYTGRTLINAGTLSISADANLGTAPGAVTADSINFTGSSTLQITGAGSPTINSNRGITLNTGVTGTVQVVDGANTVTYGGVVTGIAGTTLAKTGAGTLDMQGNSTASFLGALTVDGGTLKLSGNGEMAGTSGVTISNRGTLTLDNTAANLGNRTAGAITSSGGTLNFIGNAAATTETLGALTLNAGALTINSTAGAGGSTLTIPSVTRSVAGGTLYLNQNTGASTVLSTAPALTNSILKYAVVTNGAGLTSFANYPTSGGANQTVVPLALASHNQGAETTWAAANNVRPTADVTLTANRTSYTLTLDNNIDWLVSTADRSLTLSGGLLQTGGTSVVGTAGGTIDNILAFGANEALFHVLGTLQLNRGNTNTLTGTGGFTKSGSGTLILNGVSTLTGAFNINEGITELRGATSLMTTAATINLNGGTLRLSNDTSTTYTGNLLVNADSTIQVDRVTAAATATTHQLGTLSIGGGRTLSVNSNDITSGTAYGYTSGALTLTSGGATFDVANNGAGVGTMIVTSVTGAFPLIKTGAGDFLNNSVTAGYTAPVDIQAGRLGWGGSTGTITESQTFSGAGGLIKSGVVVVNLTGANTFTGGVTVNAGTLGFSTVSDNGGSASNLGQGTDGISLGGGTLSFIGNASQSTNRAMTLTASSTLGASGTGGASITYTGAITAGGSSLTLTGTGAGALTGGLTQTGTAADITVNSGTWTISGGMVTVADDVTVVGSAAVLNLNTTGGMFFIGGGTTLTDSTLNVQNGAFVNLGANDVSPTDTANGGVDRLLIGQATAGAVGTLNMNSFNLTSGRLDLGQVGTGLEGAITGTGTLTITSDFNFYRGTVSANLAGAAAVEKFGPGTVTFAGDNSGLTSGTAARIDAGTLALNFATSNTDKLRSATGLDMRGGFLSMNGNSSASSTQTVASLTLANGGASKISLTSNGFATTLNLGAITRAALANDGTMRFELPAVGAITTTNANNNTTSNGILGGWATVNDGTGVFFARNDGSNNIVAANTTLQDDLTLWTAGANMSDSAGFTGTLADCISINSLRFNANAASSVTLPVGGGLNIATGGILMTSNAATGVHSISGGILTSGTGEIIVTQDSTAQGLTISSSIAGAHGLTKNGNGALTLSGSNTSTGITDIQAGTLVASGGNAIGDNSAITLSDDQASTLQLTANETVGSIAGGNATTGLIMGTVDIGSNTLTLRGAAAYAGVFTGNGSIVRNTALNSANFNISGLSSGFTGTVVVDGGLLQMSGLGQLNATSFTVNKGGSLLLDNDGATRSGTRILDTTPITLNSADGTFSGQTIVRGLTIRTDQAATTNETIGVLNFNSGANYLAGEATGTTGVAAIIADNFTRSNSATVDARGRAMGATTGDRNQFRIGTAGNQTTFIGTLIGGGGAAGTQNISIVPWGIGETLTADPTDLNMGNSLITYVSGAGFRALDFATEYDTIAAAAATDNARASLSGADLTGLAGTTVNALVLHNADTTGNTTRNVTGTGAGQTLAVTSGAMLFTRDTGAAGNYGITLGGFNSGITTAGASAEYVIFVVNPDSATATKTLTATISSPLTTAADITKSGRGILILSGNNTAGGSANKTTLNEGTIQIADLANIGGDTGGLVFAGGTLQLGSAFDTSTDDVSTRTITFLNGGGTLDTNNKNPTFANTLGSGSGTFTKTGTGNLTLNATTTLTGGTILSGGEITLGANNAIGSGDLTIAAGAALGMGTFNLTVGSVTTADSATNPITGTGTLTASGNVTLNRGTFAPLLAGTANLIKNTASQTVTMSNASNSYTGYTQVVDGTLSIASIGNAGVNSSIGAPTGDNAAIRLGNTTTSGVLNITGAAMSTDRSFWLMGSTGGGTIDKDGTGELTINADIKGIGVGAKTLTLQGTAGTLSVPNVLNGEICELASTIALTKAEAGVWSLPNANTYSGTTTISAGTLMIGNNGSLGTGTLSFTGGTLDNSNGNRTLANNVSMGGTGTLQGTGDFSFTGNFSETGGSRTLNINNVGTTTIGDTAADTLTLAENNQARTLTLAVSASSPTTINATLQDGTGTGTDNLTKSGAGTLTINAANTYGSAGVGQTNLGAGTLIAGNDAAFGTSLINVTATSTIEASATRALANNLQLNSTTAFSLALGGSNALAFNGNIAQIGNSHAIAITNSALTTFGDASSDTLTLAENNQTRTLTLDVGAGGLTINSTIVDGTGTGADNLIKTGAGTMTLNASSTYTGTTALQNGTTILGGGGSDRLPVTTALSLGTGTNSATLQLGDGAGASSQTLASLATSGTGTSNQIVGGNATFSTLTINQSTNTTYAGNLGGGGANQNNLNFVKSGSGELIVSGTSTYTGTTTVNGGKLFIDSTTGFPATNNTSLTVADGAEFSLRGTGLTGNVTYGFAGAGNVLTVGSGAGTGTLGFRLDGGFNTQLVIATGQTMSVATGSTFQTAIYVDDAPTAGQGYILINGADPNSLHAGGGTFNFTPVLFNGGSFTYTLTNETLGGTVDRWVITPTVQAAAADVWWKGDLTGLGTGVWTATTTNLGNESNWDDSQSGGVDALVPPDLNSIVHFSATGAGNFATTLGGNLTIESLIFHSGGTAISVGGANTLTIGNTSDPAGLTMQTGAPNVSFSANIALAQAQSFNIADTASTLTLTGGLSGTGPLGINDNGSSTGQIILSGTGGLATYTGATNLVTGKLTLNGGASNRLPTTTDLTMGNATLGAVLQLGDATNGVSNTAIGSLNTGAATTNSIIGGATTASILTITQGSAGTFNGIIGGAGTNENQVGISKGGTATLVLNGANTYTGSTTVTNGTLQLGASGSINGTASLTINAAAGSTAVFDVNGRTAVLGGGITLGGGDSAAQANISDTATGGLLTLGGNVTFDATNNPLGSIINVNMANGAAARTFTANDSTTAATDLTLNGTYASANSGTLDGTGVGTINGAWTLTGTNLALTKNGTGTWNINAITNTTGTGDWNINVGTLNANVSNALNASEHIIVDGTGVQDSAIVNIGGTAGTSGVHQGDDFFIRNGGRVNVNVNNGISTGTDVLFIGDSGSVGAAAAGRLNLVTANISTANALQLGATGGNTGNITGTGTITGTAGTFSLRNGSIESGITLAGAAAITKVGAGTVTFSGTRTTTGNTAIQEGNLILDYTTNNASKIGGVLTLGAAQGNLAAPTALTLNGNSTAVTSQSVTSTTISNTGDVFVELNEGAGQAVTLGLGAITRSVVGGTVSFDLSSTANASVTTSSAAGTLGWATVTTGGTTRIGAISGGAIAQATTTSQNNAALWGPGQNVINTAAYTGTVGDCNLISSLTFDAAAASTVTIGAGKTLYITSGGILVNSGVGVNASVITGGSIFGSTTAPLGELIIHQNNTGSSLTINSDIVNSSGITKSGDGTLVLGGTNTFLTSSRLTINEGTVQLNGGSAIGDSTIVIMRQGTTLDVNNTSETIGNLGVDTTNHSAGTIDLGSGTLTINQSASSSFAGGFIGTGGVIKAGTGTLTLTSSSAMSGTLTINGGNVTVNGAGGFIASATTFTLNGAEFLDDQNDGTERNRIGDGADFILNNTAGTNGLFQRTNQGNTKTENIGDIRIGAGHNVVTSHGNATSAISVLQADTLSRLNTSSQNHGTVLVRGNNLGASSGTRGTIAFDSSAQTAINGFEVGGGGAAGTTNISVIPWAIGHLTETGLGNTFVTNVDATVGLRPLASTEYINDSTAITGTLTDNIRYTATAAITSTPTAINSLVLDSATAIALTGSASSMEVTAGAILAAGNANHSISGITGLTTGGGRDYIIYNTGTGTLTIAPALTSAVALVKSGQGTLSLTNTGNLFTDVYLNQGALLIDDLDKVNGTTNTLHFAGGILRLAAGFTDDASTKPWNINTGGGTLDVSLVTANSGVVTLANGIDDSSGGTGETLTVITRSAAGAGQLLVQGSSSFQGTTVFNHTAVDSASNNSVILNGATNAAISGNIQIGSNTLPTANQDVVIALGASEQIVNTASITFRGSAGEQAYFKLLGNTETVAGISDTTANGIVSSFETGDTTPGGPSTLIVNSSSDFSFNGFFRDTTSGATSGTAPLTLTKQGAGTQTLSGAEIRHSGATTISGGSLTLTDVTNWQSAITNNATLNLNQTTGSRNHTQVISGTGAINKFGAGTIVIPTATTNTYSGQTNIEQGILSISTSTGLGDASATNTIRIANNSTLQSTGANVDLGANRAISMAGNGATIDVTSTNILTAPGVISGDECHTLTKTGTGLLVISNAANAYTGLTNVNGGILQVGSGGTAGTSGTGQSGTGTLTVASGASLAGAGTVQAPVVLSSGATLHVGEVTAVNVVSANSTTNNRTLTFTAVSGTSFASGSTIKMDITSASNGAGDPTLGGNFGLGAGYETWAQSFATATGDHDRLVFTNANPSIAAGAEFIVSPGTFGAQLGQVFNLVDWFTAFSGFAVGTNYRDGSADGGGSDDLDLPDISTSGYFWDVSMFQSHGIVVVVPEPGRMMLLMLALFGVFFRRRRS